ncbi:MAG: hypothetical protein AABX52_01590 [Nanoarchaeota archaeon]
MGIVRHRFDGMKFWQVPKMVVVSKDVFSMEYLYFMLHEWLIEHKYCTRDGDAKFRETYYEHRDFGGGPREIIVRWRFKKNSDNIKFKDPLFYYELDIDMHALGIKPTEIVVKGRKLGADTGEIEVTINARVVWAEKYWKQSDLMEKVFSYVIERPFKTRYLNHRIDLSAEVAELQEALKTYFQVETYLEEPQLERWHVSRTQENL